MHSMSLHGSLLLIGVAHPIGALWSWFGTGPGPRVERPMAALDINRGIMTCRWYTIKAELIYIAEKGSSSRC